MSVPVEPRWEFRVIFDAYTDDMARLCLEGLSEGVVRANMIWLNAVEHEVPCCLNTAGIKYIPPIGCGSQHPCQTILGAAEIFERGTATCIDIACYVAAVLRMRGEAARVVFVNMKDEGGQDIPGMYHALVETKDGMRDYTQDLIDESIDQCSMDCRLAPLERHDVNTFDPRKRYPAG